MNNSAYQVTLDPLPASPAYRHCLPFLWICLIWERHQFAAFCIFFFFTCSPQTDQKKQGVGAGGVCL